MRSLRIFTDLTPEEMSGDAPHKLDDKASHHASSVMRLSKGSFLILIDNQSGREFNSEILSSKSGLTVIVKEEIFRSRGISRINSIAFASCKGNKNDLIVEKATELGAENIILWQADRSISKITEPSDAHKKMSRWHAIAESAAKQCHRNTIPVIYVAEGALGVIEVLAPLSKPEDIRLICSLSKNTIHPSTIQKPTGQVSIAIGPEGDFTPEEESIFLGNNFQPITLGPNILRAETAAIAAMGMVHGLWQ